MRRKLPVALLAFSILVLLGTIFLFQPSGINAPRDGLASLRSDNFAADRERWKGEIDRLGTVEAYELFKKEVAEKPFGAAHSLAHVMGELIYEKEGIAGVAFCDSAFTFGCYHSFFGRAISENGVSAVKELDDACIARYGLRGLGCMHGIGHGVIGYMGDDRLVEALEVCSTLSWKEPIGGCTSGVFMEYNLPTMESAAGIAVKPLDAEHPRAVCENVPQKFRQACYYEAPQWWAHALARDFDRIAGFCGPISDKLEREACFRGIGNVAAPSTLYDVERTKAICGSIWGEGGMLCKEGASWSFFAEPGARDRAREICADLDLESQARCTAKFE